MERVTRVAAQSDIGCRRKNNEDAFGYDEAAGIYVVSDGMGGSAAGEVASQTAVTETVRGFKQMQEASAIDAMPAQDLLYHAVRRANAAVHAMAAADPSLQGMGATLVAVCIRGSQAVVANVGDSRAYLLRDGGYMQITHDHSLVAEQVRSGVLTPEQAAVHPHGTLITRALGVGAEVEPDLFAAELLPGDRLLLASDGLMRHVSDEEIATLAVTGTGPADGCAALVALTRERGASDNLTCLLLEIG